MAILPLRLLQVSQTNMGSVATWNEDDGTGDPWIGYPYRWRLSLVVTTQPQSSIVTRQPFGYSGLDIQVGDWVATDGGGAAVRIYQIESANDEVVVCLVEDVDRFNIMSDPLQGGSGISQDGNGYVFQIGDDGLPMVGPSSAYFLPVNFQTDIEARFRYRNLLKNFIRVDQADHGFAVGDVLFLDSDGSYKSIAASSANAQKLDQIIGQVTSVGTPGAEWFTYKPRGQYQNNITPALPIGGQPGQLIYLDPTTPGKLTITKPTSQAIPVYIRLNSDSEGIYLLGGAGGGGQAGPLGYYASVYSVADLAARDALDPAQLQLGDQVYVADKGNGEWAHFIVATKTTNPDAVTWTMLVDQDASNVDGRTVSQILTYQSPAATDLYSLSPTTRVTLITFEVTTAFDTSATLTIGDDTLNDRLADNSLVDLSTTGTYDVTPSYQYGGTGETMVRAYLNKGTSTQGQVQVTISYI